MLLALWFDFPPASWTGAGPTPTPTPAELPDGGARGRDAIQKFARYERATEDYWEERERFLSRHKPIVEVFPSEEPNIRKVVDRHNRALEIASRVQLTNARLLDVGKMLRDLESQFVAQMQEQRDEDELLEIILLGV